MNGVEPLPDGVRLHLDIPPDLIWFRGHFPDGPVLPGVAQVAWAIAFSRKHLDFNHDPVVIERVKFLEAAPLDKTLQLDLHKAGNRVGWRLLADETVLSSGRLTFRTEWSMTPCALIPIYNHHAALERLVGTLRDQFLPVILVDDGSNAVTAETIDALAAADTQVTALRHACNQGKGAAFLTGLKAAAEAGYTHVLQIDADGQHDAGQAGLLLDLARTDEQALVSGTPAYDASVPAVRYYGRWITHLLVWLETWSRELKDSMCGYRVYPVAATLAAFASQPVGRRMDFDTEVMVRLFLSGTRVRFVPVDVRYPADGLSNFRMLRDNLRMTWLHLRLLAGMPVRLARRTAKRGSTF